MILIESGGDNLAATFSADLVDHWIYVIDVAAGDDIPRKRGLGMLQADLLVVNKIDLAPHVGADLERMRGDVAVAAARPAQRLHRPSRTAAPSRCWSICATRSSSTTPSRERLDGLLALRFARAERGAPSRLVERRQRFPLRLTVPLYLDPAEPGMAFVYVQNPTGGVFPGDDLTTEVTADEGTRRARDDAVRHEALSRRRRAARSSCSGSARTPTWSMSPSC